MKHLSNILTALVFVFLLAPIAILLIFMALLKHTTGRYLYGGESK